MRLNRIGFEIKRIEFFQPGVFVGREHAIRGAALCEHLAAFKHHMVFAAVPSDAMFQELLLHSRVASQGLWFIVVVGEHGLYAQLSGQGGNFIASHTVHHPQPTPLGAQSLAQSLQALVNELHPPVAAGQGIQYLAIEHEHAVHLTRRLQGVKQCCVVIQTQIAPKPHEG